MTLLTWLVIAAGAAVFVAVFLIVQATAGFVRAAQGYDEGAVDRRLSQSQALGTSYGQRVDILREGRGATALGTLLGPLYARFARFVLQAHLKLSADRVLGLMGLIMLVVLISLALVLPARVAWMAFFAAPAVGIGSVLFYVANARTKLRMTFEEQLPDALDLIVRSLKIGHPVSNALALIASEMPAPIGPEFGIVADQVSYGHDLPLAIMQMQERVPAPDLAYFSMAIQIQLESGGNLVESLQKLANVIRDRYRMFRKVHALTAEGRFSAWALSIFPFFIGFVVQLIRPDYYSMYAGEAWFPYAVAAVVVMLVLNIVMMRIITTIKV